MWDRIHNKPVKYGVFVGIVGAVIIGVVLFLQWWNTPMGTALYLSTDTPLGIVEVEPTDQVDQLEPTPDAEPTETTASTEEKAPTETPSATQTQAPKAMCGGPEQMNVPFCQFAG